MKFISVLSLALVTMLLGAANLKAQETLLLRNPSISAEHVAFVYGGDIWLADRDGSNPKRLTINPGVELNPVFSPDGSQVAFTGNYDGNTDVYTLSIQGGEPRRLTYHPGPDVVRGWLNDSEVYFTSTRDYQYALSPRLHKVKTDGTLSEPLLMPEAYQGSPSPDGRYWAYIKNTDPTERDRVAFKRYRGGGMPSIWIFDTQTHDIEIVPGEQANDVKPVWMNDGKVYFLSDRDQIVNVYSYDVSSKQVAKLTNFKDYDVRTLQGHGQTLVFEQAGRIHTLETNTGSTQVLRISIHPDALYKRPHYVDVSTQIRAYNISPTGQRALFESRGEIFTAPKEHGDVRNISDSPGSHERFPAWSPDGKWISYISDASGKYDLILKDQTGRKETVRIPLGSSTFYFDPTWSPDSKKLFYNDSHLNLYYVDIETQKVVKVDDDRLGAHTGRTYNHFQPTWSPDSKWIGYIKTLPNAVPALFLYHLDNGQIHQITDGMSSVRGPSFSRDGKYLFFSASTNIGLTNSGLHMSAYERPTSYNVYAFILSEDTPSIFKPQSDEETVKSDTTAKKDADKKDENGDEKTTKIDVQNVNNRIIALPLPAGSYRLDGSVADLLIYSRGATIGAYDLKKKENKTLIEGARGFQISADGKKMIYSARGNYYIVNAGQKPATPETGKIDLGRTKQLVDPVAEWNQIFNEVWSLQKEYFYVENMHGADWPAMKTKYEKFLPHVNHRNDLGYLLNEMMGEMVVGHNYIYPGDEPSTPSVSTGVLGADYRLENGRYRISKIFTRLDWNPSFKAPLAEPALNISAGQYILAINGKPLTASDNIHYFLENSVDRQVTLTLNDRPEMAGSREVVVLPISFQNEMSLRRMDWMESNRRKVDELSKGQIAYVYMPNTGAEGYTYFNRYYFSQMDKKALLLDERNNGGGWVADYVIDLLAREQISGWAIRDGRGFNTPGNGIYGPKAMIINENAGSGGDMMPYMFRGRGLGKLVGRTTMGILVGISGYPPLLDGGRITSPNFGIYDTEGNWIIENEGVAPDIFVEQYPKDLLQGRDPQLERTIDLLLEEMKTYPYKNIKQPADPNRVR
ncbi:MAG TPA: PDZ domain-containing protein [Sphingobacteriaceae bacterium]|nr:PDZ domain-containing protein [Sphingobacteriaceae bacterium]